jgi:hypothetical protein
VTQDKTTVTGLAIVGLAAAVLTFTTLFSLAVACGFDPRLAWLLPLSVDVAGLVALRIWLREGPTSARRLMLVCIALSVAGNATQHGLAAYGLAVPWWVIVVVSAVPPSVLAAVVHLAHRVARPDASEGTKDAGPGGGDRTAVAASDANLIDDDGPGSATDHVRGLEEVRGEGVPTPVAVHPDSRPVEDDELLPDLVRWAEESGVPSRNAVMKRYSVGTTRATRLLEQREQAARSFVAAF